MNSRNNVPTTLSITEETTKLVESVFMRIRRRHGPGFCQPYEEANIRENARSFCAVARMKIGLLAPALKQENQYHGGTKTTEWAKEDLKKLASAIRRFRSVKNAEGNVSNMQLQIAWVNLKYPLKPDLTPFDMLDMLANACEVAAELKRPRGKLPVSTAEAFMWGTVGKFFEKYTGVKPTATPSGYFSTVCEYIANDMGMDVPSRKVLTAAMAYTK